MSNRRLKLALACAAAFAASSAPILARAQILSTGPDAPKVPYTVEFHITRVQTLANGATITQETKEVVARDSEGRGMTAITLIPPAGGESTNTSVHVSLPDRTMINWNSVSRRATVFHPQPLGASGCWSSVPSGVVTTGPIPDASAPRIPLPSPAGESGGVLSSQGLDGRASTPRTAPNQPQREELGTDTILGVEVQGARMTRTTPAGRIGNDEPLLRTEEIWSAPSLGGLVLREITDDPRTGKSTREAVSLDLSEPDPAVFQPPEGYEIVDQELHEVPCQPAH
jgi:hypothetical protein